jgi:hypothetical protein
MVCAISCSIALVFLIGMIYHTFAVDKSDMYNRFMDTLSPSQQDTYNKIVCERRNIYLSGYAVGLILSVLYIQFFYSNNNNEKENRTHPYHSVLCIVAAITFLTSYFFYILYPKSELMIVKLDDEKQRKQWVTIYKTMQYHYHFGMVLGIIAVVFLARALCK